MEILLDGEDVLKLAGRNSKTMSYPELYKYKNIEDLFKNNIKKILLLYLTDTNEKDHSHTGHWVGITKHGNVVSFFDSYGLLPDSEIKFNSHKKRILLNQNKNYLTNLLYNFSLKKGNIVEYNQMKFQGRKRDINTCGRHAGMFCRYSDIGIDEYQRIFKRMRKLGYNLDELIVFLSNIILNEEKY